MLRYLVFFLLLAPACYAQQKPSKARIEAMRQQAEREFEKLEQEDPKTAKLLRQMMGRNQSPSDQPEASSGDFLQKIILKKPVAPPSESQAKDRLFCFKGKKIDPFTLITAAGTLVQYRPSENRLVVQPVQAKDDFRGIIKELDRTDERRNDFIAWMDKGRNRYFCYPFVEQGLNGIDEAERLFSAALGNTMDLQDASAEDDFSLAGKSAAADGGQALPPHVLAAYNEVMQFVASHKSDKSLAIPPPPADALDYCFSCDSSRQRKEALNDSLYIVALIGEESEMIGKAFSVMGAWERAKQAAGWDHIVDDMLDANVFLYRRMLAKSDALLEKYGKDFTRLPLIVPIVLGVERDMQLLGIDVEATSRLSQIATLLEGFDQYLDKQIKEMNFGVVLNYRWIFSIERYRQLLGSDGESFFSLLRKLENFNRFRLNIDAEVKLVTARDEQGNVQDWVMAAMNGSEFFSLFPDEGCRLRMISNRRSAIGGDEGLSPRDSYEMTQFHLKITEAKSTMASFAGPSDWVTAQPMFAGSHCRTTDTMVLYGFEPYSSFEAIMAVKPLMEKWNFPEDGVQEAGMIADAMSRGFPMHDILEAAAAPDADEVMDKLAAGFSGNSSLNNMKLRSNIMKLETGAFTPRHTGGLYIIGNMKNRARIVFEGELDGREDNPEAADILLARLHVRLEHAPVR